MRPMPAYVFPAGPVSATAGSRNLTLMFGSSAPMTSVPQSFLSSLPGNSFPSPPAPQIFPAPGNPIAPPSAPQTFVVPSLVSVPAAATSPSTDSARAEFVDVEGGGEATLDGNGGWSGRDVIVTVETKLKKVQARLAACGCNAKTSQIRWKWDSLLMKYKSVKAYMKRTGVAPFATLTKADRKAEKLPLDYNTSWFDMIESWYSTNPHVDPPCLTDSSNPFSGLETTQNQEEETDITERDEPGPSTRCTNSGQKRKTASKSTQVILDCIGKFSGTLLEVESRREDRENRRMQILDEVESKRIALDERRVAVEERRIEIEDKRISEESQRAKELVGALTSVATAITNLCALKAQQNS
ncbi:hypothetical protein R1flu_028692 [Riccia fluitans]|uniref:Uncharacterized protein n=1 Tax=Riccia fluitans TaxID=41844 RepID=A0ABD1XME5_9MARC